jgi:hypothetical protein
MEQSSSWQAKCFPASPENSHILLDPKVHFRIYESPSPVLILSQSTPCTHHSSSRSISVLSSYPSLGLTSGLCPLHLPIQTLYTALLSPMYATCPALFIIPDLISRIIFVKSTDRKASCTLRILVHSPLSSSRLGPPRHPILEHSRHNLNTFITVIS